MKVKCAEGRMVRDPVTLELLPPEGRDVPETQFWHRRVRDGDVIVEEAAEGTSRGQHHRRREES